MGYFLQIIGGFMLLASGLYFLNSVLAWTQGDAVEGFYAIPSGLFLALSVAFLVKGRRMIRDAETPPARRSTRR
jgi:membrane protein implicated in regulation of membrane protease activity